MKQHPITRRAFALSSIALTAFALSPFATVSAADPPIPKPDGKPADMSKPVQVFILLGQSNMLGKGKIAGGEGSLENAVKTKNKYSYLVDDAGAWLERKDVRFVQYMSGQGPLRNEWLAHRYDVYLGFDEVQTAGGQTGTFFAIDQFALPHPPQAVATGKKLGNGVVYMLRPMRDCGILDSTWGGSLADMVRFVEEMKIVREEELIAQVPAKTARLEAGLRELAGRFGHLLFNPRGLGLYQGFTMRRPEWRALLLEDALDREDLLLLEAGRSSVRLRPPLDVTVAEIDDLLDRLARVLQRLSDTLANK